MRAIIESVVGIVCSICAAVVLLRYRNIELAVALFALAKACLLSGEVALKLGE